MWLRGATVAVLIAGATSDRASRPRPTEQPARGRCGTWVVRGREAGDDVTQYALRVGKTAWSAEGTTYMYMYML